jgi:hypothetical protein
MKNLLSLLLLCACTLMAGCQLQEERSVAEALGGLRFANLSSIDCDKAKDGKRQCEIKYDWMDDSASKVKVMVDPLRFPDDKFSVSWEWQEFHRYWRASFSTSVNLKELPRDQVVLWVSGLSQLVAAQAEVVAKDELAAARKRQQIWQSYRDQK